MKKAKTASERVNKHRTEAKRKGRVRREYYATPDEHAELKQKLAAIRRRR